MHEAGMTILIVCGDPSGDLHGSRLARTLKEADPSIRIAAVGGTLLKREADVFIEDLASRGIAGFWEPVLHLGRFVRILGRLKRFMLQERPAALVCIDYYGFNRRVLAVAKNCGVPAYYYVSPQVWASRPGRVQVLKNFVKKMFVIFPFEEKIYRAAGVPCVFVGHPLLDIVPQGRKASDGLGSPLKIGILPGSRPSEISRHLPVFLEAFSKIRARFPQAEALVFAAPGAADSAYDLSSAPGARLVRDSHYQLRAQLDLAITSSGTATLENALLGLPMVVAYRTSRLTYWIAKSLIKAPYISMANILAGKALVPELIQDRMTPAEICEAALAFLEDPQKYRQVKSELSLLRAQLGQPGAAARSAKLLLEDLKNFNNNRGEKGKRESGGQG